MCTLTTTLHLTHLINLSSSPSGRNDHNAHAQYLGELPGWQRKCLYSQTDECSALRLLEQNCAKVCKIRLRQASTAQTLFLILWSTDVAYSLETCSAKEEKSRRERERDRQAEREEIKDEETKICPDGVWVYMGPKAYPDTAKKKKKGQTLLAFLLPFSSISTTIILTLSLWMQDLGCCPPILARLTPFSREKESREGDK